MTHDCLSSHLHRCHFWPFASRFAQCVSRQGRTFVKLALSSHLASVVPFGILFPVAIVTRLGWLNGWVLHFSVLWHRNVDVWYMFLSRLLNQKCKEIKQEQGGIEASYVEIPHPCYVVHACSGRFQLADFEDLFFT